MKKILFPCTNRVHYARQQLLLKELAKYFEIDIQEYKTPFTDIASATLDIASHFDEILANNSYDLVLIRGDRFEMLPIAMMASYRGIRIAHLEGGDLSGAIDNKVRKAITALADIHFSTNKESYSRLIAMGTDPDWTFNFGSLDVEYAKSLGFENKKAEDYIIICHHALPGEDPSIIEKIIREEFGGKVYVIKSNSDNGTPYGTEEFSNEDYICLIAGAKCLVGNSSSFLKEASIFGTPVVNIGTRQINRLKPHNVKDVPFNEYFIRNMIKMQMNAHYSPSNVYYQENTSLNITSKILEFIFDRRASNK